MARPARDLVTVESLAGGDASLLIDRSTQYEILTDLTQPSTARFEFGDEGTWEAIRPLVAIGSRLVVAVNGFPRLTGRLLTRNLAVTADGGATVQAVIRTRLADAMFTTCDTKIGVKNTTLEQIVLAAFARMGLTADDFITTANLARDVLTGRASRQVPALEIRNLREEEARPHAPETVYQFVDRHLSRFGLMMWDAPDGRIVIGAPDDEQNPIYVMSMRRDPVLARANNLLSASKVEDFEEVPRDLWVFGVGGGRDQNQARVKFVSLDPTLFGVDPVLDRTAVIIDESIKTQQQAEARARREMMRRSLMKDTWTLQTDSFHYWTGTQALPYVVDTVADVAIDVAGGASGPYLVYGVAMRGNASDGHTTQLTCAGRGVWRL
jgi:prophage tail gpP-like protein